MSMRPKTERSIAVFESFLCKEHCLVDKFSSFVHVGRTQQPERRKHKKVVAPLNGRAQKIVWTKENVRTEWTSETS